jgi:ribonuclease BN (tRNA processing enzyme)
MRTSQPGDREGARRTTSQGESLDGRQDVTILAARKESALASGRRLRIRFLGSGDAFGSGGRFQTSMLVDASGFRFLVDCGASTLIALKRAGIEPNEIEAVLLSHLHGDHFGGIPFLVLDGQFRGRKAPLLVAGPPGLRSRLDQAMEILFPGSSRTKRAFELEVLEMPREARSNLGPIGVIPFEVTHPSGAPAYALRVEAFGRVVTYSGDTEWTDALVRASDGADLFIVEAYFYEKRVPYHLDYQTLLSHRDEITAKRILITHMSLDMLERLSELEVEAASDDLTIEV